MLIVNDWVKGTTTTEDVSFEVKPLDMESTIALQNYFDGYTDRPTGDNISELCRISEPIFKSEKHFRNLTGVGIQENGVRVDASYEDLLTNPALNGLLAEIVSSWVKASQPTEEDSKNSEGQSPSDG